jgi:hypothetical protein
MLNVVEFFDEFQKRVDLLYRSKFQIDEALSAANKRPDSTLDVEKLYLKIVRSHDRVRSMSYQSILDKNFIAKAHDVETDNPLRPFYNIYTRLYAISQPSLLEYLARHIVENVANPILTFDAQGAPLVLTHSAVLNDGDLNAIVKDVHAQLKKFPYIAFLYSLSLCETFLPIADDLPNGSK